MAVYKDKRGRLFVEFQYKGERVKERLPEGATEADGKAIEIVKRNEILKRSHGLTAERPNEITFERFLKEYFGPHIEARYCDDTFDKAVKVCEAALPFFKGKLMRHIKPADVERFKVSRERKLTIHKTARKPATVARELSIISKIFTVAVKNGFADFNPYSRVEKDRFDNVQIKVLKREDEERFFANMFSEWARDVCRFALYTGLRQNDIMNLTKFQVDRENEVVRLIQGKTKRIVEVPLNSIALEIINRRWRNGLLFASPASGTEKGSVRHAMYRACDRIKIARLSIRDLRRTFATRALENGNDSGVIADVLGHTSLRMILRYAKSLDAKRKLVDSLENPATIPQRTKLKAIK